MRGSTDDGRRRKQWCLVSRITAVQKIGELTFLHPLIPANQESQYLKIESIDSNEAGEYESGGYIDGENTFVIHRKRLPQVLTLTGRHPDAYEQKLFDDVRRLHAMRFTTQTVDFVPEWGFQEPPARYYIASVDTRRTVHQLYGFLFREFTVTMVYAGEIEDEE